MQASGTAPRSERGLGVVCTEHSVHRSKPTLTGRSADPNAIIMSPGMNRRFDGLADGMRHHNAPNVDSGVKLRDTARTAI